MNEIVDQCLVILGPPLGRYAVLSDHSILFHEDEHRTYFDNFAKLLSARLIFAKQSLSAPPTVAKPVGLARRFCSLSIPTIVKGDDSLYRGFNQILQEALDSPDPAIKIPKRMALVLDSFEEKEDLQTEKVHEAQK